MTTMHDWTRVPTSVYHGFHTTWIAYLSGALNAILPEGYYAQPEQHLSRFIADVLTLHTTSEEPASQYLAEGGLAVAEVPPKVSRKVTLPGLVQATPRTVTVRHTTGHRIVALIELVSPSNKDSSDHLREFVHKVCQALRAEVQVTILDPFLPGKFDPSGIHGRIAQEMPSEEYELPEDKPLTFVSYSAGHVLDAYIQYLAVGDPLPNTPMFLTTSRYVELPLASTYLKAVTDLPRLWLDVLEGRRDPPNGEA